MRCARWVCVALALAAAATLRGAEQVREPEPEPEPRCPRGKEGRACYPISVLVYRFAVNQIKVTYNFIDGDHFTLRCPSHISLDEPALPRFEPALRVREVRLACPPPARGGSYAAALLALNVTALTHPTYLIQLQITHTRNFNMSVLAAMSTLRNLSIHYTTVTAADLALLPAGLERLNLSFTGVALVPAAALARLPHLTELRVQDKVFTLVEADLAAKLSSLKIASTVGALVSVSLPDTLERLRVKRWSVRQPQPWDSCAGLDSLFVYIANVKWLPDGWLARCTRLRALRLEYAQNLRTLAAGALRGATALQEVELSFCALEALLAGLLDDAPALRVLSVAHNHLHTLPGELFISCKALHEVDLSFNRLDGAVLDALGTVTSLSSLHLHYNRALDACPLGTDDDTAQGSSPLRALHNLTALSLWCTGTARVCADWRRRPRLAELDLSLTNITQLTYADLQFDTRVDINLVMSGTDVTRLSLSRADYESAARAAASGGPALTLILTEPLRCDCALYWTAAALRLPGTRLLINRTHCEDGRALNDVLPDELVCAAPGPCPAGCTCVTREDAARPGPLLRLRCGGAGLASVPRLDARAALQYSGAEPVALDLRLADNHIDRLRPEDLPIELTVLDLRNNSLGLIDTVTAAALVSRADRRVLLAGNPLECDCRAAAALHAIRTHPDVFSDWEDATCSNGTVLALATPQPCDDGITNKSTESHMSAGAVVALVLCAAAAITMGLALTRHSVRQRLWGAPPAQLPSILQLQRRRPKSGEWAYDAFISFAHADEAIAQELVERLEGGEAPLRVCVHYRDWMPGGWIPEQIAASVRVSRRTVALISEAFLRSKWARAEFREAYAAALEDTEPRLVLVLLEDPTRLRLDSELAAYVSGVTYVRWGDPWFWQKLRQVLPVAPPPRCAAESPAACTSATPPPPPPPLPPPPAPETTSSTT